MEVAGSREEAARVEAGLQEEAPEGETSEEEAEVVLGVVEPREVGDERSSQS
jgi:hypothetical protein